MAPPLKLPHATALAIEADLIAGTPQYLIAKARRVSKDTVHRVARYGAQCWAPGGVVPSDYNRRHVSRIAPVSPHRCRTCGANIVTLECIACVPGAAAGFIEGANDPADAPRGEELAARIAEVQSRWTDREREAAAVVKYQPADVLRAKVSDLTPYPTWTSETI